MGLRTSCSTSASDTTARALRRGTGTGTEPCFTQATLTTRTRTLMRTRHARFRSTGSYICSIAITTVNLTSYRPSPALQAASIASCCACCFCTNTGRRHASLRSWTTSTRNHTHISVHLVTHLPPRCFLEHSQEQNRSSPPCLCPPVPPLSEKVQGVAMSIPAKLACRELSRTRAPE